MDQYFRLTDGLVATIDCSNWNEFQQRVKTVLTSNNVSISEIGKRYIFRGQSCSSWGLTSSFDRLYTSLAPKGANALHSDIIEKFRQSYLVYGVRDAQKDYLPEANKDDSDERFETLAQHYGVPTRLLDFTKSPYIAAFFAFSKPNECATDLVSVWALDLKCREVLGSSIIEIEDNFYLENVRQQSQLGVFVRNKTETRTLDNVLNSGGEPKYYNKQNETEYPLLYKFDIPVSECDTAIADLELMNINSLTVFPGIEGVVSWINKSLTNVL